MWSTDIEAAKRRNADDGQVLAEVAKGYFQVVSWDDATGKFRENTNMLALRSDPIRWRPIPIE